MRRTIASFSERATRERSRGRSIPRHGAAARPRTGSGRVAAVPRPGRRSRRRPRGALARAWAAAVGGAATSAGSPSPDPPSRSSRDKAYSASAAREKPRTIVEATPVETFLAIASRRDERPALPAGAALHRPRNRTAARRRPPLRLVAQQPAVDVRRAGEPCPCRAARAGGLRARQRHLRAGLVGRVVVHRDQARCGSTRAGRRRACCWRLGRTGSPPVRTGSVDEPLARRVLECEESTRRPVIVLSFGLARRRRVTRKAHAASEWSARANPGRHWPR